MLDVMQVNEVLKKRVGKKINTVKIAVFRYIFRSLSLVSRPRGNDEARGAKYIPEYRNFNSVYIVLEFLSASNVYQRRDVLLFFWLFKHILSLGG